MTAEIALGPLNRSLVKLISPTQYPVWLVHLSFNYEQDPPSWLRGYGSTNAQFLLIPLLPCYPPLFGHFSPQLMWLQPIINIIKHYKTIYDILKPICWNSTTKHEAYHHFTWHYITIPPKRYLILPAMPNPWPQFRLVAALGAFALFLCWRCRPKPLDDEDGAAAPEPVATPAAPAEAPAEADATPPERTAVVARRMIFAHLGVKLNPEQRREERDFWERRRNGTNGTRSERNGRSAWEEDSVMIWRGRFSLAMPWLTSMICPLVCKLIVYFWFPLLLSECPISKFPIFLVRNHTSSREC